MRISLRVACARASRDKTARAAPPTASSRNSRRFIQSLLNGMPQIDIIIPLHDDGVALERCRVLRKNSNDNAAQQVRGDGFIAETSSAAAHFSWRWRRANSLILNWD